MRQGMASGQTGALGTARVPKSAPTTPQQQQQQQQQQFNFSQGYSPMTGNPPTSPSHFNPMSGGPLETKLSGLVPLNNQTLVGGPQGQFSSAVNTSMQHGLFQQFGVSGEFKEMGCTVNRSKIAIVIIHNIHMRSPFISCLWHLIIIFLLKRNYFTNCLICWTYVSFLYQTQHFLLK